MGSFSVWHWLIVLAMLAAPLVLISKERERKRREAEDRRAKGLDPNDRTRS